MSLPVPGSPLITQGYAGGRHAVLRTGQVSRTGGCGCIPIDVRAIASTSQSAESGGDDDLWKELHDLNAVEIRIPPSRQRLEEIPLFASFFLEQFNRRHRRTAQLCPDAIAEFRTHAWPGNIRELEPAVYRAATQGSDVFRSLVLVVPLSPDTYRPMQATSGLAVKIRSQ